ncbi:hypothetical protein D5272_08885 [bacterium D16-76]|nr:hypothetical protein [bacterium D16-76]
MFTKQHFLVKTQLLLQENGGRGEAVFLPQKRECPRRRVYIRKPNKFVKLVLGSTPFLKGVMGSLGARVAMWQNVLLRKTFASRADRAGRRDQARPGETKAPEPPEAQNARLGTPQKAGV